MDQPTAPGAPTGTPGPKSGSMIDTKSLGVFDQKTIESIKWGAIAAAAAAVITNIASYSATRMTVRAVAGKFLGAYGTYINEAMGGAGAYAYSVNGLISDIIQGAIAGAIGGWVLAKFFPVFLRWNQQFLKGKLDTFFKLLFVPTAIAAIILALLGSAAAAYTGFSPWLIIIIGLLVARFTYAKVMDMKVGKFYPMK